jgi:hypothetical protein
MMTRGFVDLLFILLCGALIMLSQSVRIHSLPADPADAGHSESTPISKREQRVLVVADDWIGCEGNRFETSPELLRGCTEEIALVLVPSDDAVSHHRIIRVWNELDLAGRHASLGVNKIGTGDSS